jgi:hypothetical protein
MPVKSAFDERSVGSSAARARAAAWRNVPLHRAIDRTPVSPSAVLPMLTVGALPVKGTRPVCVVVLMTETHDFILAADGVAMNSQKSPGVRRMSQM